MRTISMLGLLVAGAAFSQPQPRELKTADAVLERYEQALGGVESIRSVQSETRHGEVVGSGINGKITFTSYAKPFKWYAEVSLPDGRKRRQGFDGTVNWSIGAKGAAIDDSTPLESVRRDADLQYPLHQPDYFAKIELAGVAEFEGHRCYWLHGTTHWGKDNNQFYDVNTGLLVGYRFQSDDKSSVVTITVFDDYKKFGGHLVATKNIEKQGDQAQTTTFTSVSYEPIDDSIFALPAEVKALQK